MKTNSLVSQVQTILAASTVFMTPREIGARIDSKHSDSSITARIRDLRKEKYGGYKVEAKRIGTGREFAYRIAMGECPKPKIETKISPASAWPFARPAATRSSHG